VEFEKGTTTWTFRCVRADPRYGRPARLGRGRRVRNSCLRPAQGQGPGRRRRGKIRRRLARGPRELNVQQWSVTGVVLATGGGIQNPPWSSFDRRRLPGPTSRCGEAVIGPADEPAFFCARPRKTGRRTGLLMAEAARAPQLSNVRALLRTTE